MNLLMCDECANVVQGPTNRRTYHLELRDPAVDLGEATEWDFCSTLCLYAWADGR